MYHNVHSTHHEMIGGDFHDAVWPVPPFWWPWSPHLVGAPLKWGPWGLFTGYSEPTVLVDGGAEIMQRGTDIGPGIVHLFIPHTLLPALIVFSGSKAEFGANSIHVASKRLSVAIFGSWSLNLNCGGFTCPPLPSGIVPASSTVQAAMTWADVVAGWRTMIIDSAIQYTLGRVFNRQLIGNLKGLTAGSNWRSGFSALLDEILSLGTGASGPTFWQKMGAGAKDGFAMSPWAVGLGSPLGASITSFFPMLNNIRAVFGQPPLPTLTPLGDVLPGALGAMQDEVNSPPENSPSFLDAIFNTVGNSFGSYYLNPAIDEFDNSDR